MKPYLKPNLLILSCQNLNAKLQGYGDGISLLCSGTECGSTLGAFCKEGNDSNYVDIIVFEKGINCPVSALPYCDVLSLTVGRDTHSFPNCWVNSAHGIGCNGCVVEIACYKDIYCNSSMAISASVDCLGFWASCTAE